MADCSFVESRLDYVEREDEGVMMAREVNRGSRARRENRVEWLARPWPFVDIPLLVPVIYRPL
jgi:hypothetical protein